MSIVGRMYICMYGKGRRGVYRGMHLANLNFGMFGLILPPIFHHLQTHSAFTGR